MNAYEFMQDCIACNFSYKLYVEQAQINHVTMIYPEVMYG